MEEPINQRIEESDANQENQNQLIDYRRNINNDSIFTVEKILKMLFSQKFFFFTSILLFPFYLYLIQTIMKSKHILKELESEEMTTTFIIYLIVFTLTIWNIHLFLYKLMFRLDYEKIHIHDEVKFY